MSIWISSCTNDSKTNVELKKQIDSVEIKTTRYELQVDSLGSTIDTISIERKRINDYGTIVFIEKNLYKENSPHITSTSYYRNNDNLFCIRTESPELGTMSISEFWDIKNETSNGISYGYKNDLINDTTRIDYKHYYDENKSKIKTLITSHYSDKELQGNITELKYNNDNTVSEIYSQNGDTLVAVYYSYENELIKKIVINNYINDNLILYNYDLKGYVLNETLFTSRNDSIIKFSETIFNTDEEGTIINSVKKRSNTSLKEYFIFITEKN